MKEFDPAPTEHEVTSVNFSPKTIQKYKKRLENGYDLPDEDYQMRTTKCGRHIIIL